MSRKYREPEEVPNEVIADRLDELASVVAGGDREAISREFVMRIPAQLDRCPDLVMSIAASRLRELEQKAEAFDATLDYVKRRKVCGAMRSMDMTIRANVLTDVETFMKNSLDEVKDETE